MMDNIQLSVFSDAYKKTNTKNMTLAEIVKRLQAQTYHDRIYWLRDALKGQIKETAAMNNYDDRRKFYKDKRRHGVPIFFPIGIVDRTKKPIQIVKRSNVICIDIDRKENYFVNFDWIKLFCSKSIQRPFGWSWITSNVAQFFCSVVLVCTSISGDGVFLLVKFKGDTAEDRNRAYDYSVSLLQKIGINSDDGAKAPAQFRYFSCDPNLYYNPYAAELKVPDDWAPTKENTISTTAATQINTQDIPPQEIPDFKCCTKKLKRQIETALNFVVANHVDMTKALSDWKKLKSSLFCAQYAGAINNGFGIFWTFAKFYTNPNTGCNADFQENKDFFFQPMSKSTIDKIPEYTPATLNGLWQLCDKYHVPHL